jgi:hypothetical protein
MGGRCRERPKSTWSRDGVASWERDRFHYSSFFSRSLIAGPCRTRPS